MFTTWPPPWSTICRIARWVMWKKPARLTAVIAAKSSGVYSVNGLPMKMPALLTRLSIRPKRSSACPTTRCAVSAWAMSPCTVRRSGVVGGGIEREVADDGVPGATERGREARADALRGAGDDRDLPRRRGMSAGQVSTRRRAAGRRRCRRSRRSARCWS